MNRGWWIATIAAGTALGYTLVILGGALLYAAAAWFAGRLARRRAGGAAPDPRSAEHGTVWH